MIIQTVLPHSCGLSRYLSVYIHRYRIFSMLFMITAWSLVPLMPYYDLF